MNIRLPIAICAALLAVACTSNDTPTSAVAGEQPATVKPVQRDLPYRPGAPITLLLTSDNRGEIGLCGCEGNPVGGLARRATIVAQRRAAGPIVLLDGGDALFEDDEKADRQALDRAALILGAMGEMGTAGMAVGERDLVAGVDWLVAEARAAKVPLLAANLTKADGSRPFEASRLVEAGPFKIGVIGIWGDGQLPAELTASDPLEATGSEVARLREAGADMVVALVHGPMAVTNPISTIAGVDFVLPSHQMSEIRPFQRAADGGWLLGADSRGRQMLRLQVHPAGEGTMAQVPPSDRKAEERIQLEHRARDARARIDKVQEPEARAAYRSHADRLEQQLATLDAELADVKALESRRRFTLAEEKLRKAIPPAEAIEERVKAFEKRYGLADASLTD